ncbi:MAG: HsmA family protein [Bacteroidetes bacterium]|nr:HsmA family protein [Bacteroidota bacterium]
MHSPTLIIAISFILLALVLYTIGVWAERLQHKLMWWHTAFFWAGLTADTTGTTAMSILSGSLFAATFHGITGNIAIFLMGFHAIWATVVLIRKNEKMILNFHRFSIVVWTIWLIPMISGIVFGASR